MNKSIVTIAVLSLLLQNFLPQMSCDCCDFSRHSMNAAGENQECLSFAQVADCCSQQSCCSSSENEKVQSSSYSASILPTTDCDCTLCSSQVELAASTLTSQIRGELFDHFQSLADCGSVTEPAVELSLIAKLPRQKLRNHPSVKLHVLDCLWLI